MIKKSGFTLAEVLIVLVILGVVAAMTVPNLLNNSNSAQFSTGIKKAFSSINQTIQMAAVESGEIPGAGENTNTVAKVVSNIFGAHMRVSGYGTYDYATGTWTAGTKDTHGNALATADGMIYHFVEKTKSECPAIPDDQKKASLTTPCAKILVDVNGRKGPNAITQDNTKDKIKDQFVLYLYSNGVVAATDEATAYVLAGVDNTKSNTATSDLN